MGALHEVVHHVLNLRLEGLLVHLIEVDLVLSADLQSLVVPGVVDLASHVFKLPDQGPLVPLKLKEEDRGTGSCDKDLPEDEEALTHISVHDLLSRAVALLITYNAVPLPIEGINLFSDLGVEGSQREVPARAVLKLQHLMSSGLFSVEVINEVIVLSLMPVVSLDEGLLWSLESFILFQKGNGHKRLPETLDGFGVAVDATELVDTDRVLLTAIVADEHHEEVTTVPVSYGIHLLLISLTLLN